MENFQRVKFIGKDGFGAAHCVYKDKRTDHKVVLKIVDMRQLSAEEREYAKEEVKVLETIKHPNIVQYQEFFHDGYNLCIVMEYCEGGDLLDKIENSSGPLPEQQIWNWVCEICQALKYLHGSKIIHRDLKPPNLFLTKENSVRLGDFGLAKVLDCTAAYTQTFVGTVAYMPPEMVLDQAYNNKIDIWTLGVTLYQMATKRLPFMSDNIAAMLRQIVGGTYQPITGYSKELCCLVDKLLTKEPRDRPSITELLQLPEVRKHAAHVSRLHNIYSINDRQKYCLIFYSSQDRNGAQDEADVMENTFSNLGFDISRQEWKHVLEFDDAIVESLRCIADKCSVVVICIMAHGYGAMITGENGSSLPIDDILHKCRGCLPDYIPLVMIIQACRELSTNDTTLEGAGLDSSKAPPCEKDNISLVRPNTLLVHATVVGGTAVRGALAAAIAKEVEKADEEMDFPKAVTHAFGRLRQSHKQTPIQKSTLQKSLHLTKQK